MSAGNLPVMSRSQPVIAGYCLQSAGAVRCWCGGFEGKVASLHSPLTTASASVLATLSFFRVPSEPALMSRYRHMPTSAGARHTVVNHQHMAHSGNIHRLLMLFSFSHDTLQDAGEMKHFLIWPGINLPILGWFNTDVMGAERRVTLQAFKHIAVRFHYIYTSTIFSDSLKYSRNDKHEFLSLNEGKQTTSIK